MSANRKYDIIGKKFGCLTVRKFSHIHPKRQQCIFECVCDCGNVLLKLSYQIKLKPSNTCPKCRVKDLSGIRVGRLQIIKKANDKNNESVWIAKCDCGKETLINGTQVKKGHKKTCGCHLKRGSDRMDLTGLKTSKFQVLEKTDKKHRNSSTYQYICKCNFCYKEFTRDSTGISKNQGCRCIFNDRTDGYHCLYNTYRECAKKRKLEFLIDFNQFLEIIQNTCYYCGSVPEDKRDQTDKNLTRCIKANGIDRKNNKIGYILENCVACCKMCNIMKFTRSIEEFLSQVEKIQEYQKAKREVEYEKTS